MDEKLETIVDLLSDSKKNRRNYSKSHFSSDSEKKQWNKGKNVFIDAPPKDCEREYFGLFTDGAIEFLADLFLEFEHKIERLYDGRMRRKLQLRNSTRIPEFSKSINSLDRNWKVAPVGKRLENRHLDLGDVSPSDLAHFTAALKSPVQGVQVDFDDGHCPTWKNQITGLHNVGLAVRGLLPGVPKIKEAPILMLRPRAWNMIEKNVSINGRRVPGALFDFSMLMYHNGREIFEKTGTGGSFYLSKLEGAEEAKLWKEIFVWSEKRLGLPRGSTKACVLIENILSAFEMDEILWELREHSLGLNCGIWDYAASIISKFGTNDRRFLLPDRKKYVNAKRKFLRSYMQLVVEICHKRGAPATGGMAANLLPIDKPNLQLRDKVVQTVRQAKLQEIQMGLDGFIIYDLGLVEPMNKLWRQHGAGKPNQIEFPLGNTNVVVKEQDLLSLPEGGVTLAGLRHNIRVGILFIFYWLNGKGHFAYDGFIEDSATAEISRSQVWQWIRYGAELEDQNERVTRHFVKEEAREVFFALQKQYGTCIEANRKLIAALDLFLDLVNRRDFPEFITTYLNEEQTFRKFHSNL
ncbi:malate synthase-like [Venturia canescens]|uniref:malate synthase-like n=1 Tax=Venturia canescens TaxID=32260 RepID=UPI001C9C03D1|nr:malate synthase-like [Venturia canescens]